MRHRGLAQPVYGKVGLPHRFRKAISPTAFQDDFDRLPEADPVSRRHENGSNSILGSHHGADD